MSSPTLRQFIGRVEAAVADLEVALQEARQVAKQPDEAGIDVLEATLYDQIDGRGNYANFQIGLNFDRLRDEITQ